jgi:hypothetical protein
VEDLNEKEAEGYWQSYVEYLPVEVLAEFEATN